MDKILIEVDPSYLEEVIGRFGENGDVSHIHTIEEMLTRLKASQTRDESLSPHAIVGNNVTILHLDALLQKIGYSPAM
ncbi:MAG TPA: hypothetical protein VMV62_01965 [Candidatus Paceibacterota bacterium]|nr:hypothetical protein [Candidatus Paceibacterota bacterium]